MRMGLSFVKFLLQPQFLGLNAKFTSGAGYSCFNIDWTLFQQKGDW
jgi:hypothetical protein